MIIYTKASFFPLLLTPLVSRQEFLSLNSPNMSSSIISAAVEYCISVVGHGNVSFFFPPFFFFVFLSISHSTRFSTLRKQTTILNHIISSPYKFVHILTYLPIYKYARLLRIDCFFQFFGCAHQMKPN